VDPDRFSQLGDIVSTLASSRHTVWSVSRCLGRLICLIVGCMVWCGCACLDTALAAHSAPSTASDVAAHWNGEARFGTGTALSGV